MTDASALQAAQQPAQAPFSGTLKISVTSALGLIPIANAQIVISYETQEEASAIARKLNDRFSSQIGAYANKYVVDVVPKGISKAHGLHFLKDYLHIKETDIYAIGDAENDIPLMEFADQGCCMTSGKKELHAHAKYVCDNISDYIELII